MKKAKKNPQLDSFFSNAKTWKKEMEALRTLILECGLTEVSKWDQPVYTFQDHNVVIIGGFKKDFVLSFFKGMLLKDPKKILELPGPDSRIGRVVRFTNMEKIVELKPILQEYIAEAIEIEKSGVKIDLKNDEELEIPSELQKMFGEMPELEEAWEALTPGRKRGYVLYFASAKQVKTQRARIEKYIDTILDGLGIHDEYLAENKKRKKK